MAKRRRVRWDRVILVFGPLVLLILIIGVSCHHRDGSESGENPTVTDIVIDSSQPAETDPNAVPTVAEAKPLTICIDAGHGGNDSGATDKPKDKSNDTSNKRLEKDDNLRLALAVQESFRKYPDIQVIMTRETDVYVELQERCDIANNANADFFISLHRNMAESGKGVEVWINNESMGDNTMDKLMSEYILDWLEKVGISERRGIHYGFREGDGNYESNNYYVNRYTNMPSILLEMGFMTSKEDNRNFDDHLSEYADAIAGAMVELLTDKGLYPAQT